MGTSGDQPEIVELIDTRFDDRAAPFHALEARPEPARWTSGRRRVWFAVGGIAAVAAIVVAAATIGDDSATSPTTSSSPVTTRAEVAGVPAATPAVQGGRAIIEPPAGFEVVDAGAPQPPPPGMRQLWASAPDDP